MEASDSRLNTPMTAYAKYRSQHKTNALLNRLHNDSGYPQDMFKTAYPTKNKNYLQDNKKNLKNFYTDRIAKDQSTIYRKADTIDPARMLTIRKQQYELKSKTRMSLQNTLSTQHANNGSKRRIRKISQIFAINDKNREFKKNFLGARIKCSSVYETDNYRKGTTSSVQKKAALLKKEAYQKVFGPDVSSVSRTEKISRRTHQDFYQKQTSMSLNRGQTKQNKQQHSKQFRRLIGRMKDNYKQFSANGTAKLGQMQIEEEGKFSSPAQSTQVVDWIKAFSSACQKTLHDQNRVQLQSLEDLDKLDPKFYLQMKDHKRRRLNSRMLGVDSSCLDNHIHNFNTPLPAHQTEEFSEVSVSDVQEEEPVNEIENIYTKKKSMKQVFKWLGDRLISTLLKSKIFNIKKENLYDAFFSKASAFQKEGSYTFFKSIKQGKIDAVRAFLSQNPRYLYERDDKARSPLMVAVRYQRMDLVKLFIQLGSNLDHQCATKKRSLYFSLANKDLLISKLLLQNGASPWSTLECDYKDFDGKLSKQLFLLMKNARKFYIGYLLIPVKEKVLYWSGHRQKINEHEPITF